MKPGAVNRAENVRPISPADPDFTALFRRRNDAESINRALEDTMWLRRAHSVGHRRQLLNLLGYALSVNSLALARQRRQPALASAAWPAPETEIAVSEARPASVPARSERSWGPTTMVRHEGEALARSFAPPFAHTPLP